MLVVPPTKGDASFRRHARQVAELPNIAPEEAMVRISQIVVAASN